MVDKKIKVSKAQKISSEKNVTSAVVSPNKSVFRMKAVNKKVLELNLQLSALLTWHLNQEQKNL